MPREPHTDLVEVEVLDASGNMYRLSCNGKEAMFPKSQVNFPKLNTITNKGTAEIPVWLLRDRGWDKPGQSSILDDMPDE